MADIDLKTETPDTTLPTDGFLFGADSQSAASPSVYPVQSLATTLLGSTTLSGATVTTDAPVLNLSQTWNDAAVTFTGLKLNVTDTASAAGSLLMNLQRGGNVKFSINKAGGIQLGIDSQAVTAIDTPSGIGSALRIGSNTSVVFLKGIFGVAAGYSAASAGSQIGFSTDPRLLGPDTILTRKAAANFQLGAADAAAPVAQTLSVQSVVAGTTDTAGANLTIAGSQGTGTGAGGSIVFQVAPAGTTGTAQNALVAGATLAPSGTGAALTLAGGTVTASAPVLNLSQTWNDAGVTFTGLKLNVTDTASSANSMLIDLQVGGTSQFSVNRTGGIRSPSLSAGLISGSHHRIYAGAIARGNIYIDSSSNKVGFEGPLIIGGNTANTTAGRFFSDGANTLAQRNDTNAQESRIYGSYTSETNFQRMSIKTLRESSGALSGASYTTTIVIPAYAHLIGVTTRVTTEVTGATTYDVGDGSDVDLWGAAIGVAVGSESRTIDFTDIAAVGPAATSRTVTLTANGSNFTAGVIEICLHYLTTEAD
jgi:hypothetical protein